MQRRTPAEAEAKSPTPDHVSSLWAGQALVTVDPYRAIIFPNAIREWRRRAGMTKLLQLASQLPHIPYVRLSKIERGEVVAKAHELIAVARVLAVRPEDLLIDIDRPGFDIAQWAADLQDWEAIDPVEDRMAVMLAAALRARRERDAALTIAVLERDYGIAPVILSRLENAQKPLDRWNAQTLSALCRIFDMSDVDALRAHVVALHQQGELTPYLHLIANPALRMEKSRVRIAALRRDLAEGKEGGPKAKARQPLRPIPVSLPAVGSERSPTPANDDRATVRLVPVYGAPLADGLIARVETGETVAALPKAGPRSYGLRVCKPTLGPGLPARAIVIVDPDCFPSAGGLAVVREDMGLRILLVTFDRSGRMMGYSQDPDREMPLDGCEPASLSAIVGAVYE